MTLHLGFLLPATLAGDRRQLRLFGHVADVGLGDLNRGELLRLVARRRLVAPELHLAANQLTLELPLETGFFAVHVRRQPLAVAGVHAPAIDVQVHLLAEPRPLHVLVHAVVADDVVAAVLDPDAAREAGEVGPSRGSRRTPWYAPRRGTRGART